MQLFLLAKVVKNIQKTAGCSYRFVYARHEYFDLCAYNEKNASKHLALRASLLACIDIGL